MQYIRRIVDEEIDRKTKAFNAINIIGPKGSGKTRTAKERCKTIIEFQDEDKREGYISVADTAPSLLLEREKPILFDEWQDAPKMWGAIRKACDDHPEDTGSYYLTGSTGKKIDTPHTGTGRISETILYPMTLFESGYSNGSVSLYSLFNEPETPIEGKSTELSLKNLFFIVCCGGWPRCFSLKSPEAKLEVAKDYYNQIISKDISSIDGVKRNPEVARLLLWSYARNMATIAKLSGIYSDVKSNIDVSDPTLASYVEVLQQLFVIRDIDAWTPQIRSKTAIRASKKHIFIDPSIGTAALGISPDFFLSDLDTFGHIFENLIIRDLLVYAQINGASVKHYRDDTGLEADAVFQLRDGRYALIEIKTGTKSIPSAESNLLKFHTLIREHNEKALKDPEHPGTIYREPDLLIIICANAPMSYTTANGVKVIPAGCLSP